MLPWADPLYTIGIVTTGSTGAYAVDAGSNGFGPVTKGPAATSTSVVLTSPTQVHGSTPATVVAQVSPAFAAGSVQLLEGSTLVASAPVNGGVAIVVLPSGYASGSHSIVAKFVPADPDNFAASVSSAMSLSVASAAVPTKTTLSLSKGVQAFKRSSVKATATVSVKSAVGSIVFADGKKVLKTVKLKKGKASFTTSKKLSKGKHAITATFVPADAEAYAPSASKKVTLKVAK